ncbi:MAG: FlgD immunoglobulin-like domain containing protein [bacterium]
MKKIAIYFIFILFVPTFLSAQVKLNEVLYSTSDDQIELKNFGSTSVNVSSWWFCALGLYDQISTLTVVSGELNIPPGGLLALSGKSLNNSASDLGLYSTNAGGFTSPSDMEDFVQWGSGGLTRESVAVSKGIWTAGEFVATVAQGSSIEYDGDGNLVEDWFAQPNPTIGAENGIVTGVDDEIAGLPDDFILTQNFPNPFNPSTNINYTIPQSAPLTAVQIDIFNLLGQKVRTLVNASQSSGTYRVQWDAKDNAGNLLASGVYIYRLQAGALVDMKKMILLR